jgi:histidinol-phosphate aminotransferase
LIDEAYDGYLLKTGAYASFIDHPVDNNRLVVTRTFSKIYGLAGARIGYAVASPETAQMFPAADLEPAINIFAAKAAGAALSDQEFVERCFKRNLDDRQEFLNQVNARHGHVVDPQANFIFMHSGRPAKEVIEHFVKNGILIGPAFPAMNLHVRVSLGTAPEMQEFWRVWDLLIPAGMMMMK